MNIINLQFKIGRYGFIINKQSPTLLSVTVRLFGPRHNAVDYFIIYFSSSNTKMEISFSNAGKAKTILYVMAVK